MSRKFRTRKGPALGDFQADIFTGLAILFILLCVLLMGELQSAKNELTRTVEELRAEEAARKAEEEQKLAAQAEAKDSKAAEAAAKRRERDARKREKSAQERAESAKAAAERMMGRDMSYEDLYDCARIDELRRKLKEADETSRELAEQVVQMAADIRAAERDASAERTRAERAERAQRECEATKGGDPDGTLISAGLQIFEPGGDRILLADTKADPAYTGPGTFPRRVRYECKPPVEPDWIVRGGGGNPVSPGGMVGK